MVASALPISLVGFLVTLYGRFGGDPLGTGERGLPDVESHNRSRGTDCRSRRSAFRDQRALHHRTAALRVVFFAAATSC
jgi:hypothetical protein